MSNTSDLMDLLFAGTRQRVLALLLLEPASGFHLRELARKTGSHAGTLARELEKLTAAGLLLRSTQGNQVRYRANRECPLFDDLAALFRKTHGVADVLRKALAPVAKRIHVALLFGSMARGTQTAGSDVDVLVLGTLGFAELVQALFPAQQLLGREINPVLYSREEFRTRANRGGAFVRQVQDHANVVLLGSRDDLAELAGNRPPATAHRGSRGRTKASGRGGT